MKILVAVDSSQASMVAAREAAARPWPAGTTVRVVSVVEPLQGWSVPEIEEALHRSACQTIQCAAEHFKQAGLATSTAVLIGDPKHVIVREAEDAQADFIVIGAHSTHGVMQFLLGGVARAVARLAPCSVEIVRRNPGPEPLKILLAVDDSECSKAAARSVAGRPWPAGACFRILSVIEASAPLLRPPYFSEEMMEQLRGKDMQRAQEAVSSAEDILYEAGIQASSTIAVPAATPKELILSEAAEWAADLIVVGSHGRRGVNHLLLGSVSEAIALHAQCSVEIIRSHPDS
ncbi:MAG TPA: universal stress protein [Bryobacteraceae bacterium]|nr:universal stress protein [Bryobacteraceae bacterium]